VAKKYMKLVDSDDAPGQEVNRYGHLMSFRVDGPPANARKAFDAFKIIFRATDLGRIKSVATIPAISTHSQQGEEARKMADVPPQLIRLCVGGEDPDDIIADLDKPSRSVASGFSRVECSWLLLFLWVFSLSEAMPAEMPERRLSLDPDSYSCGYMNAIYLRLQESVSPLSRLRLCKKGHGVSASGGITTCASGARSASAARRTPSSRPLRPACSPARTST
jgi:hypothetical protein